MRHLRVGMFTDSYLPRVSGVVRSVHAFTEELRRLGHEVWVITPRHEGAPADDHLISAPSVHLRRYPDFPFALPLAPGFIARVRGLQLDVVHAHSPFVMGRTAASVAARLGRPLVFTHHTLYGEYLHYVPLVGASLTRPLIERYVISYANRCAAVISPSGAVRDLLRDQGVTAPIEVVPTPGPDPAAVDRIDPAWVRPRYGVPAAAPLVLTVSRLAPEKSVDVVVRAFALIAGQIDARLLVVGDGPSRVALEALAADLGVGDRVAFAGLQPHEAVLACARAADLFLYASQTETQGLVIVEAMAAGLPVVAVAAGGVAEAVADGAGTLVGAGAGGLASAALAYLRDPALRREAGARGRRAAAHYTTGALAQRLLGVYASVPGAAPGRAAGD